MMDFIPTNEVDLAQIATGVREALDHAVRNDLTGCEFINGEIVARTVAWAGAPREGE